LERQRRQLSEQLADVTRHMQNSERKRDELTVKLDSKTTEAAALADEVYYDDLSES